MRAGAHPVLCPLAPHRAAEVPEIVRLTQAVGYVAPSTHEGFDHTAMAADIAGPLALPAPGLHLRGARRALPRTAV
ncbi:hypothetical protein [Streptomyces sp. NPDC090022]|uniref:hypothetical protein n=1 Tax=Streptomyces sp. NPDC090022 TaxID=3365920 RepID=UPI0037F1BF34